MTNKKHQQIVLIAIQFFVISATSMSDPYWPIIIQKQLGGITTPQFHLWNILVYILPLIATTIVAPFWGMLADKFGYKPMVLRAVLGLVFVQGLLILAPTPAWIAFLRLLQGILCGFIASTQALALRVVIHHEQTMVISALQSAAALGTIVGPILSSLVFIHSNYNYHSIFLISCLICMGSSIAIWILIKEPIRKIEQTTRNMKEKSKISVQTKLTYCNIFLAQTASFMILPFFALFVLKHLHETDSIVGLLYAASAATLFIFSPLMGRLQTQLEIKNDDSILLIVISLIAATLTQFFLANTHDLENTLILRLIWGASLAGIIPLLYAQVAKYSDENNKGKFLGFASSANKSGNLCGILMGSLFYSLFGISRTIMIIGAVYLLCLISVLYAYKRHKRRLKFESNSLFPY